MRAHSSLLIRGGTILDGLGSNPVTGKAVWIQDGVIKAICAADDVPKSDGLVTIDASGKYLIPGILNANVHLLMDIRLENLLRHWDEFEEIILEAAQISLKNGVTSVFDTYGPRRHLVNVRDRINDGRALGSRIYCAGNIVGFDGPFSPDFFSKVTDIASASLVRKINAMWVENVGRHLMWLTPAEVAAEVAAYIERGIDFVKYGSNEHFGQSHGAFLAFSDQTQKAIVEECKRKGRTVQAHTMTVEGLRMAVEAGCNLIQHANHTGPKEIPKSTFDLIKQRGTGAVVFPMLQSRLDWLLSHESYRGPSEWRAADSNVREFVRAGAKIVLGTDGLIYAKAAHMDPFLKKVIQTHGTPGLDNLFDLATGHFVWLKAMQEKGLSAPEILKSATYNVAESYGKEREIGSLQPGLAADIVILSRDPFEDADNYRSISTVIKDGKVADTETLPHKPIMTRDLEAPLEEEGRYVEFLAGGTGLPMCPTCLCH